MYYVLKKLDMGKKMKKTKEKLILANVLVSLAQTALYTAANSRCMYVYHQPKQPENVKRYRRF